MEAKQVITLKQVLAQMAVATEPFSLRYVKCNEQKNTGGEVVELHQQLLSQKGQPEAAPALGPGPEAADEVEAWMNRAPNHFENMTRNLVSKVNGHYTKVHIYLITEFEGKKVII
jgi:hypothetical protein